MSKQTRVVQDFWRIVNGDHYAWIPVWGEGRCGKTTLSMLLMYAIYKDWDDVLSAIVFNLSQLIYKMKRGIPRLFPTVTKPCHMRVPILTIDDFAAQCGKAKTQHEKAWDLFKGSFDTLGTRVGILLGTMIEPTSPTQQLLIKYTHEIMVQVISENERIYKYDRCKKQQDFSGWKHRQKKNWLEQLPFGKVPLEVYKQYDEMRLSLVDEAFIAIEESMAFDTVEHAIKRMEPIHFSLLRFIKQFGMINHHKLKNEFGEVGLKAMQWCKSYGLVVPVRRGGTYYLYDITDLGIEILKECAGQAKKTESSIKNINV